MSWLCKYFKEELLTTIKCNYGFGPVGKLREATKEMVSDAATKMVCVSGNRIEDELNTSNMSKDDDEKQAQTHDKTCIFEGDVKFTVKVRMDRDIKVNSAVDQLIIVKHCASAKTLKKPLEVSSPVLKEFGEEVVGDSKFVIPNKSISTVKYKYKSIQV